MIGSPDLEVQYPTAEAWVSNFDICKSPGCTPEDVVEALTTSGALAGTYTITGNTVTMERAASSRPEGVGVAAVREFTVEGDTLNLRGVSGLHSGEMNWHRAS